MKRKLKRQFRIKKIVEDFCNIISLHSLKKLKVSKRKKLLFLIKVIEGCTYRNAMYKQAFASEITEIKYTYKITKFIFFPIDFNIITTKEKLFLQIIIHYSSKKDYEIIYQINKHSYENLENKEKDVKDFVNKEICRFSFTYFVLFKDGGKFSVVNDEIVVSNLTFDVINFFTNCSKENFLNSLKEEEKKIIKE